MKSVMLQIHRRLESIRPGIILAISWAMIGLITWVDYATRETFDLSHFYLLPLYLCTWFGDVSAGVIAAGIISLVWGIVEWRVDAEFLHAATVVWNSAANFIVYCLFCVGLSTFKDLLRQLHDKSNSDPLTGAANRRCFYESANSEINRSKRYGAQFSVVYFDVDDFKALNDTHGHIFGDEFLCRTVSILFSHSRDSDIVARLGGDEFAVLLPGTCQDEVKSYITKLQPLLTESTVDKGWLATFSIGVITYKAAPESVESMISRVDDLMYSVKKAGKNSTAFLTWPDACLNHCET